MDTLLHPSAHNTLQDPLPFSDYSRLVIGLTRYAGPLFEKHVRNGTRPFKGSVMVVTEEDTRSLLSRIESDIYVREGVWNLNQARIMPFRTLLRWQNGPAKSNQDY